MRITILQEHDEVEVWTSLLDDDVPPHRQQESFIIGTGTTRDEAINAALTELADARRELEAARTAPTRPEFPPNRIRDEGELP
jgi:hypothetical protein